MPKWQVIGAQDRARWDEVLARFPQTDIYFSPAYHRIMELNGDGAARGFIVERGDDVFFHAFFVRPIDWVGDMVTDAGWFDLESAYGYTGPLCTTTDSAFLAEAWAIFDEWCNANHIVAEFIRFHPLLGNHRLSEDRGGVAFDRETVVVSLAGSDSDLWESYPSIQRNMVRKALKKGLVCTELPVDKGLTEFRDLYCETMARVGAQDYYYFSEAYFENLGPLLGEQVRLFAVEDGTRKVAAALFFLHADCIHYHLAASLSEYASYAPGNLLLHSVAQWGQARGMRWLHLGGGRTADPRDRLLAFKASLSRSRLSFYTGRKVHMTRIYERLCSQWVEQRGLAEQPNYFLMYRLGKSH